MSIDNQSAERPPLEWMCIEGPPLIEMILLNLDILVLRIRNYVDIIHQRLRQVAGNVDADGKHGVQNNSVDVFGLNQKTIGDQEQLDYHADRDRKHDPGDQGAERLAFLPVEGEQRVRVQVVAGQEEQQAEEVD